MKLQVKFIRTALLCAAFMLMSFSVGNAYNNEYSFKVRNNTRYTIKQLLVAEPGAKSWKYFDIGNGIAPGKTATLVWDESTDDEDCVQWFKAVYSDNVHSEPAKFDFCEEGLVLTFSR